MKVNIRHIAKDGFDLDLNRNEAWLVEALDPLFPDKSLELETLTGHMHLDNLNGNIALSGNIVFTHHPSCARCGESLTRKESINLQATFVPTAAISGEDIADDEEDEVELTGDDVNFSFYEGEEIDVAPVIRDETALALPYNQYCQNTELCRLTYEELMAAHADREDPRLAVLKSFKPLN